MSTVKQSVIWYKCSYCIGNSSLQVHQRDDGLAFEPPGTPRFRGREDVQQARGRVVQDAVLRQELRHVRSAGAQFNRHLGIGN